MKLAVIGTGYVGLVSGACLADAGNRVTCIDIDAEKIERLRAGEIPIFEPGLDRIVQRTQTRGRLFFTTELADGISDATIVMIAVGTPQDEDGSADLAAVEALDRDRYAATTHAARASWLRTWLAMHAAAYALLASPPPAFPLTCDGITRMAALFKAGGYMSYDNYAMRAKSEHLAMGLTGPGHGPLSSVLHCALQSGRVAAASDRPGNQNRWIRLSWPRSDSRTLR